MRSRALAICLPAVFMALAAVSCGKKNLRNSGASPDIVTDIAVTPAPEILEDGASGAEGDIRGGAFVPYEGVQPVYFLFDEHGLSEEARDTLQRNAQLIKTHKSWILSVEGHCDSRGTTEYNLALGQKRAKEVREYYTRLGVPGSSIGTISYGEEKPSCAEGTQECWARNRRADTKIRADRR